MEYKQYISSDNIIYASIQDDVELRAFLIKWTSCEIDYYKEYPLSQLEKLFLNIICSNEKLTPQDLALELGFNYIEDEKIGRYRDEAERAIFDNMLQGLLDWGLIKNDGNLKLTEIGKIALDTDLKYKFFSVSAEYPSLFNIKDEQGEYIYSYQYIKELGLSPKMFSPSNIPWNKCDSNLIGKVLSAPMVMNVQGLVSTDLHICAVKMETTRFYVERIDIDYHLYQKDNDYLLVPFKDDVPLDLLTVAYLNFHNQWEREKKIEWSLYMRLIHDPNARLTYDALMPFEDIIDIGKLIPDSRMVWTDEKLLGFIVQNCDANEWSALSKYCDIEALKNILPEYKDKFNWIILSERFDYDFISETSTEYPWDYNRLATREPSNPALIKKFLVEYHFEDGKDDGTWDWDNVMPLLDWPFIKSHLSDIPFNLYELTRTLEGDDRKYVAIYPAAKWDWTYVVSQFPLGDILSHLLKIKSLISLPVLFDRVFVDEHWTKEYLRSADFVDLVKTANQIVRTYNANTKDYYWSDALISLFEDSNVITWGSRLFLPGFAENEHIDWNYEYFAKYHNRVCDQKGYDFVSASVKDRTIIENYPEFNWNWNVIASNKDITEDLSFVEKFHESLPLDGLTRTVPSSFIREHGDYAWDWEWLSCQDEYIEDAAFIREHSEQFDHSLVLKYASPEVIEGFFHEWGVPEQMSQNQELCDLLTNKMPVDFVKKNISCNWNWAALTRRIYKSIKLEAMGSPIWIDRWDWDFLTKNLSLVDIEAYSMAYSTKWVWETYIDRVDSEYLLSENHLKSLADAVNSSIEDRMPSRWQMITRKFSLDQLQDLVESEMFGSLPWDYSYMYSLPDFDSKKYLEEKLDYIHWPEFSKSPQTGKLFEFDTSSSAYKLWLKKIKDTLDKSDYKWDFTSLSQHQQLNEHPKIFDTKTENWDWHFLSANAHWLDLHNRDNVFYLERFKRHIDFTEYSRRRDAGITENLVERTEKKLNWDWDELVLNESIVFSFKFISTHQEKAWDWSSLSAREDADFEIVYQLKDKPWNWSYLSSNPNFKPSLEILTFLSDSIRDLDWKAISKNENLELSVVEKYANYLDFNTVTRNPIFDISNNSLIEQYKNRLDWHYVISNRPLQSLDVEFLMKYKDYITWNDVNNHVGVQVPTSYLLPFKDKLDWRNVSASHAIDFTPELIQQYKDKWYWDVLFDNYKFKEDIPDYKRKFHKQDSIVQFLSRISSGLRQSYSPHYLSLHDHTPCVYHFTHLYNVVDVLRTRKILSRDRAKKQGLLKYDSAGNVVGRTQKAHSFARFYFRPKTPTQYYNEALGVDSEYYEWGRMQIDGVWQDVKKLNKRNGASNLGWPKCPMPVFLKFDLSEILSKMPELCYYSNGNMQTNYARVFKVTEEADNLNVDFLYSTIKVGLDYYKEFSQQEFLIKDEFDFSNLDSYQIICYDGETADLLRELMGDDTIVNKISTYMGGEIFDFNNRSLSFRESSNDSDTVLSISSDFQGEHYYRLVSPDLKSLKLYNPQILSESDGEVRLSNSVVFQPDSAPVSIYFVDPNARTTDWLIYSNSYRENFRMKQTLPGWILELVGKYENEMDKLRIRLDRSLFYPHMVDSYHGVGHVSRVLFFAYLIANEQSLSSLEKEGCYLSAIIHDLGKRDDVEGEIHGYRSMERYKDKITELMADDNMCQRILDAVRYHSVPDNKTPEDEKSDVVWKVLKDADALDRFRFGGRGCDKSFLRMPIFRTHKGEELLSLARNLQEWCVDNLWNEPYKEIIQSINQFVKIKK